MNDQRPERRRFQFGLRKLLLWTGVVAVLLGLATTTFTTAEAVVLLGWMILVAAVRWAFGPKAAGALSVAAALILHVSFSWLVYMAARPFPDPVEAGVGALIVGGTVGGLFGLVMFGIAEGAVRAVNWADKVLETKSDGEPRRD
jgi:hypothetical protein